MYSHVSCMGNHTGQLVVDIMKNPTIELKTGFG